MFRKILAFLMAVLMAMPAISAPKTTQKTQKSKITQNIVRNSTVSKTTAPVPETSPGAINKVQIPTTQYVRDYLSTAGKLPDLTLNNVGSFQIPTEKYVMSAIDHVNAENGKETHYADNASSNIPMDLAYFLKQTTEKLDTCPVPWDTTPGMMTTPALTNMRTIAGTPSLSSVNFADGVFYSSTGLGMDVDHYVYSTDGINWVDLPGVEYDANSKIAYGNGSFVFFDYANNRFMYSEDMGQTWNDSTLESTQYNGQIHNTGWQQFIITDLVYVNGKFVASIYDNGPYYYNIYESDNGGKTWYDRDGVNPPPEEARENPQITVIGDRLCSRGTIYSYYGIKNISQFPGYIHAYGNGTWVGIPTDMCSGKYGGCEPTPVYYSTDDGTTWSETVMPMGSGWGKITYANGMFVALGAGDDGSPRPGAAYSYDGIKWYELSDILPDKTEYGNYSENRIWWGMAHGNGVLIIRELVYTGLLYVFPDMNVWAVGDGCAVVDGMITCDAPLVGGVATCENAVCSCTRQKLIKDGEYVDNIATVPVEINRTFTDQNACNLQCADVCEDNAVNNTDGAQKDILCGK